MGLFNFRKKKRMREAEKLLEEKDKYLTLASEKLTGKPDQSLTVIIEQISSIQFEENKLVEITDTSIIGKISALIPSHATAPTSVDEEGQENSQPVYKVVLKNGDELESKLSKDTKKGVAIGTRGLKETATIINTTRAGISSASMITTVATNGINFAAMIVGQYFIQQIDTKISALQYGITNIKNFLDVQYKSQVVALLESVYGITKYQNESLSNKELRFSEIEHVQQLELRCLELLNQAEIHVQNITAEHTADYSEYVTAINAIEQWLKFQHVLYSLLNQLSVLDFALHIGSKPKQQCFEAFDIHTKKIAKVNGGTVRWHKKQCDILKINLDDKRRKHTGFLSLFEKPFKWINDKWNYKAIDQDTINLITSQAQQIDEVTVPSDNPFNEDTTIISVGDKFYYLPKQ